MSCKDGHLSIPSRVMYMYGSYIQNITLIRYTVSFSPCFGRNDNMTQTLLHKLLYSIGRNGHRLSSNKWFVRRIRWFEFPEYGVCYCVYFWDIFLSLRSPKTTWYPESSNNSGIDWTMTDWRRTDIISWPGQLKPSLTHWYRETICYASILMIMNHWWKSTPIT